VIVDNLTRFNFQRVGPGILNAPAILYLNLRRKWFAKIAAEIKRIEYRDCTSCWRHRLDGRKYDFIQFRNPDRSGLRRLSIEWQTRSRSDGRGVAGTRSLWACLEKTDTEVV